MSINPSLPLSNTTNQTVNEVKAARPATSGNGRQVAGQHGFAFGGERSRLLMTQMGPLDVALVNVVSDEIQRVAHDPVAMLYARLFKNFDNDFRNFLAHVRLRNTRW